MQILLTEKEYDALKDQGEKELAAIKDTLQDLCTKVADHMPIDAGWRDTEPSPWECILTHKHEWYCDECPVQGVCPCERKNWSK